MSEPDEAENYFIDGIPLVHRLTDHMTKELPSIQTTCFSESIYHDERKRSDRYNDTADEPASTTSHGFFFGSESLSNLSVSDTLKSVKDIPEEEDDMEDEGISEIYRPTGDPSMWMRQSDRSFKLSPETTPRHVISRRIANVGGYGHNIGLGHRLGVFSEDATLIPKTVTLSSTPIVVTENSPVQIDVTWSRPSNASNFATLIYKVEVNLPHESEDQWREFNSVRNTTIRIYHTDDKLLVGKYHVIRQCDDLVVKLRVRCHGELMFRDTLRHWTMSSYSNIVEVTFVGYTQKPEIIQLTDL